MPSNVYVRFEEAETGRELDLVDFCLTPLGFTELVDLQIGIASESLPIPLELKKARLAHSSFDNLPQGAVINAKFPLLAKWPLDAVGLVPGGWLPIGIACHENCHLLPDSNLVGALLNRRRVTERDKGERSSFLDFLLNASVRINPILVALEGNTRSLPSPEQIRHKYAETVAKLRRALPNATITPEGAGAAEGIIGLIEDQRASFERKTQFLLRIAPLLNANISRRKRPVALTAILEAARAEHLKLTSMLVFAAVSAAAHWGKRRNSSKAMLKFREHYSTHDAHNALSDIRALELLAVCYAAWPADSWMLCTADKDLALFWSGIQCHNFRMRGHAAACEFTLIRDLVRGFSDEELAQLGG